MIPVYRDVARALSTGASPAWPSFAAMAYLTHQAYFDGLVETYGAETFGPAGLPGAVEHLAPSLRQALAPAPTYDLERSAQLVLSEVERLLPGTPPELYLGTLFFIAPAATISVGGRPAIALGLERFHPSPPDSGDKFYYHPSEVVEMVPHEAAHAARMSVLRLPPTPRHLSLLDLVMLEGTALTFTDQLLGRQTLATFLPADRLAWHEANDAAVRLAVAREYDQGGMPAFLKYFSAGSPISGYYVGYSLCREYLNRYGPDTVTDLVALPSRTILSRLTL